MSETRGRKMRPAEWRWSFWGRDVDRDIDDELRFHLEMRERDFVDAGLNARDAHDAAMARFGNVLDVTRNLRAHDLRKQRHERRVEIMGNLAQDIRYGLRKLLQAPGFSAAVILILALGIGVNSAIFSAVDSAMLRPLPFRDADRLVLLNSGINFPSEVRFEGRVRTKQSPDIIDVAAMKDVVQDIGAYTAGGLNLGIPGGGNPARVRIAMATPTLLTMLGGVPVAGRVFVPAEADVAQSEVAILSEGIWKRQFGADSSIVGKTILLNGISHTVVGVMSDKFVFPAGTEVWIPMTVPFAWSGARGETLRSFFAPTVIAKLAPGVTPETAGKRIRALFEPYATQERPIRYSAEEMVVPLQQTFVADRQKALWVLMGAAALVLLTACANVTNLLLSRAAQRRREIGIRTALGASRVRIVQQLLTESLLLSVVGGALGVLLAFGGLGVLTAIMPAELVDIAPPTIDLRVLVFSLGLSMTAGLVFGLWPAFGVTRNNSSHTASLRSASSNTMASDGRTLRRLFVVSEMAFAMMLLVGAGLMLKSFRQLLTTDTGIRVEQVASMQLSLPMSRYPKRVDVSAFHDRLLQKLRSIPAVEAAASINEMPLRGEGGIGLSVQAEGKPKPGGEHGFFPLYLRVTSDYFRTMGIRLLAGRSLSEHYDPKIREAVINKVMADSLWPGENAVGKRFAFGTMPGEAPDYITVVGVIGNVRSTSVEMEATAQMYLPFAGSPSNIAGVVVSGRGDRRALIAALATAVKAGDPEQATYNLQSLGETISRSIAPRRTNTILFAAFGVLAVVLSAYGVHAVIAYGVAQQTREIGIRIALGAEIRSIVRMVMREGLVLGGIGIAIGLAGAWAIGRIIESLLFGTKARDPLTFAGAALLLMAVAVAATIMPARMASRVDPLKAIRTE